MINSRNFITSYLLLIFSIYIPILGFSIFDNIQINSSKNKIQKIEEQRRISIDKKLKINAINLGYIPTFYPHSIFIKSNKLDFFPIGTYPNSNSYLCNEGYGLIKYGSDRFGLFRRS